MDSKISEKCKEKLDICMDLEIFLKNKYLLTIRGKLVSLFWRNQHTHPLSQEITVGSNKIC